MARDSDAPSTGPMSGRQVVGRRMARHYLEKIRSYVAAYEHGGEQRLRSLQSFDKDWSQIQVFQRWATEYCEQDPVALEICHLYAERGALLLPLMSTEQAIQWLLPAIEAAQKLQLPQAELAHRRNLGLIYDRAGRHEEALVSYRAALAMATAHGTLPGRADLLHRIGKVLRNLGKARAQEAEQSYHAALEAMQQAGDPCGEARVRIDLGNVRANQGFYTEALEHFAPARALLERPECGDTRDESMLLGYLGNANRNLGRYQEAEQAYQAAIAMAVALRERKTLAEHHFNLALLYRDIGQLSMMHWHLIESQGLAQEYQGARDRAKVQNGLASYHALRGDFAAAIEAHDEAIHTLQQAAAHFLAEYVRADKGRTLLMAGRPSEALELLQPVAGGGGRAQHPLHIQQRGALLAHCHLLQGCPDAAAEVLSDARMLDEEPNTVASRHRAAALHGIALARAEGPQAVAVLRQAVTHATERITADRWELAALVSRGLASYALALLGDDDIQTRQLRAAKDDLALALRRCNGAGFRAELATMLGILRPLDQQGHVDRLLAEFAAIRGRSV